MDKNNFRNEMSQLPDGELIILAIHDNGRAFTALWDRHISKLRAYLSINLKKLVAGLDVDDICSRSFEKAFRQIGTYDATKGKFITWLCTIARNTAKDLKEIENRNHPDDTVYIDDQRIPASVTELPDSDRDQLDRVIANEDQDKTVRFLGALPDLYRDVAKKYFIEEMKYKEIAEEMDLPLNTVKTRISRARTLIGEMKKDYEK